MNSSRGSTGTGEWFGRRRGEWPSSIEVVKCSEAEAETESNVSPDDSLHRPPPGRRYEEGQDKKRSGKDSLHRQEAEAESDDAVHRRPPGRDMSKERSEAEQGHISRTWDYSLHRQPLGRKTGSQKLKQSKERSEKETKGIHR